MNKVKDVGFLTYETVLSLTRKSIGDAGVNNNQL